MSSDYMDADIIIRCGKDQAEEMDPTPISVSDWLKGLMVEFDWLGECGPWEY